MGGGLVGGAGLVSVGVLYRAELSDEQRQHGERRDAKFPAMRPLEQGSGPEVNSQVRSRNPSIVRADDAPAG